MIERYSREEMAKIWTREYRFKKWLEVEIAACEAQTEQGVITEKIMEEIREKADFSLEEIDEEEAKTKHEVIAFLNSVFSRLSEDACRFVHYGLTSSDVMDTATHLQLKDANELLLEDINGLLKIIKRLVEKYKYTPIIGRSHGIHAEPTTFGLKLAIFYAEIKRSLKRFEGSVEEMRVGKLSGAVGNYSQLNPKIEELVCEKIGLNQSEITNQVIQRDRYAYYISILGILAGSIEKLTTELRNLARTEIGEVQEQFSIGQKGSSAMPHKKNPVALEQLTGLCRMVRSYTVPAMENITLWHERDISHSSTERIILPDVTILMDYILIKVTEILDNMDVFTEKMLENIHLTNGLVFSQRLMMRLVNSGLTRQMAHTMVQGKIHASIKENIDFHEHIRRDGEIRRYITIEEIEALFDLDIYTRNVGYILKKVFADEEE